MSTTQQAARVHLSPLTIREAGATNGVCGRISGTALVFNTLDSYDTIFAPGCLTGADARARSGQMQLFMDHAYGVRTHIGVVRTVTSGSQVATFTADLLDTEDGRRAKEYLRAVVAARGLAGVSVGFAPLRKEPITGGGDRFLSIRLEELSITPRPAVPGAEVDSVRGGGGRRDTAWEARRKAIGALATAEIMELRGQRWATWADRRKAIARLAMMDLRYAVQQATRWRW